MCFNVDSNSLFSLNRAFLRLWLFKITYRPLMSPPIPERDFDPTTLTPPSNVSSPTLAPSSLGSSPPMTPEHLRNNHTPLPPHSLLTTPPPALSDTSIDDFLLPKALTASAVKPSLSLVKKMSSLQEWVAEILYILRPLVYGANHLEIFRLAIYSYTSVNACCSTKIEPCPCSGFAHGSYLA